MSVATTYGNIIQLSNLFITLYYIEKFTTWYRIYTTVA